MSCPCSSQLPYNECCEPYISGARNAPTPEALMRSRYTAYTKVAMPYLRETLAPDSRADFNEKEAQQWAKQSEWLGLKILAAKGDSVEFIAKYRTKGRAIEHHEKASFRKDGDRWYFVDGKSEVKEAAAEEGGATEPKIPLVRVEPKVGRNDPCSCGSGKKFKKCCAA